MPSLTVFFFGAPGGPLDKVAHAIFRSHDGVQLGAGTFLKSGERDVEYDVPPRRLTACKRVLTQAGFRLVPQETPPPEPV